MAWPGPDRRDQATPHEESGAALTCLAAHGIAHRAVVTGASVDAHQLRVHETLADVAAVRRCSVWQDTPGLVMFGVDEGRSRRASVPAAMVRVHGRWRGLAARARGRPHNTPSGFFFFFKQKTAYEI